MADKRNRWILFFASRFVQTLRNGGWTLTVSVLMFASFILACSYLWQKFGDQIIGNSNYLLSVERLNVTPQPDWIKKTDIKRNAMIRGRLQGMDIREVDLGPKVSSAFLGSPWVQEVELVNKSSAISTGVNVRLKYRKPIAMVIIDATPYPVSFDIGLLPVDVQGFFLPLDEFTAEDANRYPKIGPVNTYPIGSPGEIWGDARITEAASIIEFLGELWQKRDFLQLEVPAVPSKQSNQGNYILVDQDRNKWPWGSAIGFERPDEAEAAVKLARLKNEKQLSQQRDKSGTVDLTAADWSDRQKR